MYMYFLLIYNIAEILQSQLGNGEKDKSIFYFIYNFHQ